MGVLRVLQRIVSADSFFFLELIMTNGLLERAARMVSRKGFKFGQDQVVNDDIPSPDTHVMMPIRHADPITGRVQIAQGTERSLVHEES